MNISSRVCTLVGTLSAAGRGQIVQSGTGS